MSTSDSSNKAKFQYAICTETPPRSSTPSSITSTSTEGDIVNSNHKSGLEEQVMRKTSLAGCVCVVPLGFNNPRIRAVLKYWWNMRRGNLKFHNWENILPLNETVSRLYAKGKFAIIPEAKVVDEYMKDAIQTIGRIHAYFDRDEFAKQEANLKSATEDHLYTYHMVPLSPKANDWMLKRRGVISPSVSPSNPHPVASMTFFAHIHPRYAILAAGRSLERLDCRTVEQGYWCSNIAKTFPQAVDVGHLYESWMRELPEGACDNEAYQRASPQNHCSQTSATGRRSQHRFARDGIATDSPNIQLGHCVSGANPRSACDKTNNTTCWDSKLIAGWASNLPTPAKENNHV